MITDLRNTLDDIYEPERTPNDPKAVPRDIVDSPIPAEYSPDQGNSYASKAMMSGALISTSKAHKKKKGKSVQGGVLAHVEVLAGSDMIDMSDSGGMTAEFGNLIVTHTIQSARESTYTRNGGGAQPNDQCAIFLPVTAPPGVNVDDNIRTATETRKSFLRPPGGIRDLGETGASGPSVVVQSLLWFKGMVNDQGPWDYKYQDADRTKYENFGNFNYGATGSALGLTLAILQRAAGWQQQYGPNGDRASGSGKPPSSMLEVQAGIGGEAPFGDNQNDSNWIAQGAMYYQCRRRNPR